MRSPIAESVLLLLLLLSGSLTSALAESRVDGVSASTSISDGSVSRGLVQLTVPTDLGNVAISSAEIIFDLAGTPGEGVVRLALHPITTPWSASSARWTQGWQTPGGDFDPELLARTEVDLSQSSGQVRFDVTSILKEQLESGADFHGFLLTTQSEFGTGLRPDAADRLSGLGAAHLQLSYRKVAPLPRSISGDVDGAE